MVAVVKGLIAAAAARYASSGSDWSLPDSTSAGDTNCAIDQYVPQVPAGLVIPSQPARFIGLAFGVQNYTCSSANNYTSIGAVAELIDVSCHVNETWFPTIQNDLYNVWTDLVFHPIQAVIELFHVLGLPEVLAQHFFITNPLTHEGLSPEWNFSSSGRFKGNKDAYVVVKSKASVAAPTDPKKDIAWLDVVNIEGKIADEVFRIDTVGGQPPATCQYGKDHYISVKYTAKYVFYGGSEGVSTV